MGKRYGWGCQGEGGVESKKDWGGRLSAIGMGSGEGKREEKGGLGKRLVEKQTAGLS